MLHPSGFLFRRASACIVLIAMCGTAMSQPIVARIGTKTLSVQDFEARAKKLRKTGYRSIHQLDPQAKRQLLDGIIARELLVMEGRHRGLDRDSAIVAEVSKARRKALARMLYEREAVQPTYTFTEDELRAFFLDRQYDTEVLSQHIACDTEKEAWQVLAALHEGASFESLVRAHSSPQLQNRFGTRGQVGWFKVGELLEELKEPLSTMEVGEIYPEPVRTHVAYHVFRLEDRRPVDFAASRKWLEDKLRIQRRADDMQRYVQELRRRYGLQAYLDAFPPLLKLPLEVTRWTGTATPLFTWKGGSLTQRDYMELFTEGRTLHPALLDSAGLYKAADNLAGSRIMAAEAHRLKLDEAAEIQDLCASLQAELMVKLLYRAETQKRARHFSNEEAHAFYRQNLKQFTRDDGKVTDFALLRDSIKAMLHEQAKTQAMDAFIAELRQTYKDSIEIFPEALDLAFRN